jgi:protein gp37
MGKQTGISWTLGGSTWNPWYGCTKVSRGCKFCYAESELLRYGKTFNIVRSKTTFNDPLKWKEQPRIIFTCSWGDFFHEDVPEEWRDDAWKIIENSPHFFLLLTKRPQNIEAMLPLSWGVGLKNVGLGTTVEDQSAAPRLLNLLSIPAAMHFVSIEPNTGPVNLECIDIPMYGGSVNVSLNALTGYTWLSMRSDDYNMDFNGDVYNLDWVIIGGESGPIHEVKGMELGDVSLMVKQCQRNRTKVYVKQLGTVLANELGYSGKGDDHKLYPREFPDMLLPYSRI